MLAAAGAMSVLASCNIPSSVTAYVDRYRGKASCPALSQRAIQLARQSRGLPTSPVGKQCKDTDLRPDLRLATKEDIVAALNLMRGAVGVGPLVEVPELDTSAEETARYLITNGAWAHVNVPGQAGLARVRELVDPDWEKVGENLARVPKRPGYRNVILMEWLKSPEHAANMLDPANNYTQIGVGIAYDPQGTEYVVTHFAALGHAEKSASKVAVTVGG